MTNSAQRLQERDYRRCAPTTPKKCPHFLPIQRRCCSTAFLGSHTSTCLLNQSHCPTEGHFPQQTCANESRHMLSLFRLGMQGPNSINSLRTIGSFFRRKKKSSPCGPHFPGTFPCVRGSCAQPHAVPRIPNWATFPQRFLPHLWHHMPEPSRPQAIVRSTAISSTYHTEHPKPYNYADQEQADTFDRTLVLPCLEAFDGDDLDHTPDGDDPDTSSATKSRAHPFRHRAHSCPLCGRRLPVALTRATTCPTSKHLTRPAQLALRREATSTTKAHATVRQTINEPAQIRKS